MYATSTTLSQVSGLQSARECRLDNFRANHGDYEWYKGLSPSAGERSSQS